MGLGGEVAVAGFSDAPAGSFTDFSEDVDVRPRGRRTHEIARSANSTPCRFHGRSSRAPEMAYVGVPPKPSLKLEIAMSLSPVNDLLPRSRKLTPRALHCSIPSHSAH